MYWRDAREQHGSGRRSIQPVDHFRNFGVAAEEAPGLHGHERDDDFQNGLDRGIGHGRRYIGAKDHLALGMSPRDLDAPGMHGHDKDGEFEDGGLERGIGHGKHHIAVVDHLEGMSPVAQKDNPEIHGHNLDDDFEDGGLERGMGHGRHYIGAVDHMFNEGTAAQERVGTHGHMIDDDFEGGLQRGMGHGRRHIEARDHMITEGTSAPEARHGVGAEGTAAPEGIIRGRRHLEQVDHFDTGPVRDMMGGISDETHQNYMTHGHERDDMFEDGLMRGIGHGHRHIETEDHMEGIARPGKRESIGLHGHSKDDDFQEGIERAIGHGKHHIESPDHLHDLGLPDECAGSPKHGQGRKFIEPVDHMITSGTSAPAPVAHGHGRKHIQPRDHMVTDGEAEVDHITNQGRRHCIPVDHMKTEVLVPPPVYSIPAPSLGDMKDSIKEWLTTVYDMVVYNPKTWENEVIMTPRGNHWVIESLTEQRKSISREGSSSRLIAQKLSLMTIAELRYFGVRFRGKSDPRPPLHRQKHNPLPVNPTLASQGVHNVLGQTAGVTAGDVVSRNPGSTWLSVGKLSDDRYIGRRYIASGKDHFMNSVILQEDKPGEHGHSKDDDFQEGLERGIGHGRHYIGTRDHLSGGIAMPEAPGGHGHARADDFQDGMDRDMGHGRHYIGTTDHMPFQGFAADTVPGRHGHSKDDDFEAGLLQRGIGYGRRHVGF